MTDDSTPEDRSGHPAGADALERRLDELGGVQPEPVDPNFADRLESSLRALHAEPRPMYRRYLLRPAGLVIAVVLAVAGVAAIAVREPNPDPGGQAEQIVMAGPTATAAPTPTPNPIPTPSPAPTVTPVPTPEVSLAIGNRRPRSVTLRWSIEEATGIGDLVVTAAARNGRRFAELAPGERSLVIPRPTDGPVVVVIVARDGDGRELARSNRVVIAARR